MRAVGIIPARFSSTRFPGKPLAPIAGRPMLQWVFEGAKGSKRLRDVLVATDDERIAEACRGFGAQAILTSSDHPTGTDRLAEVALGLDDEVIVNIQGDEPLVRGDIVDAAVAALEEDADVSMATVVHAAEPGAADDPHRVKVVLDRRGRALYFSRSRIPARGQADAEPRYWQHVGLYAYRRSFLLEFVKLPPTPAEQAESLEQLRALEHGHPIRAAVVEGWTSFAVDVPGDVARVEAELARQGALAHAGEGRR
ncbi:MAG: 3-deoxy-manno-octulosonate cytidylyltransferase [Myxococcota bacterium]